jgi:two-component system nitrogen regulation response regulator NtrX
MKESILVVDDEAGVRSSLSGILGDEGYEVETVESGEACLAALRARRFDVALLDVWLPGADGLETLERIRKVDADLPVVMISGHGTIETAVRAVRLGARDFVEKPLSLEKTLLAVRNALKQRQLEVEVQTLRRQLDRRYVMVGESPAMRRLRTEIAQAAPSMGRALIFGENGTGKELVARAIHAQSHRAAGPFVEVNCAAIPEELIESELFGHVRGAFTGAHASRKGRFELADGGTLFLDEVGDMSLKTQAKVLRALQEQRVEPVGSTRSVAVDARVIAATNKNLDEQLQAGTFREDLYFRLNVIPFRVPPLRERREDIPMLARHFVEVLSAEHGRRPKPLSGELVETLARLPWPGNVRELRNIIERLVIMTPDDQIEVRHLPASLIEALPGERADATVAAEGADKTLTLARAREEFERQFIVRRYRECGGNMSRTAEALGVERSNLYRKMKAFGLLPVRREAP